MEQLLKKKEETYWNKNNVKLVGTIEEDLKFDNRVQRINFYMTKIKVTRKSGKNDHIPLMISEELLKNRNIQKSELKDKQVCIYGQFRTYDENIPDGQFFVKMYVFVNKIHFCDFDIIVDNNITTIDGYICKKPIFRITSLSKSKITQLLIAVNRKNGSVDYVPCITWSKIAERSSKLKIGTHVICKGRLQSRKYPKKKMDEDGNVIVEWKETYEMSIVKIHED